MASFLKDNYELICIFSKFQEFNLLLWAASITLLGLIMFGLYEDFNGNPLTRVQHILYQATFRILWAVGLSYVIFACLTSQGGKRPISYNL